MSATAKHPCFQPLPVDLDRLDSASMILCVIRCKKYTRASRIIHKNFSYIPVFYLIVTSCFSETTYLGGFACRRPPRPPKGGGDLHITSHISQLITSALITKPSERRMKYMNFSTCIHNFNMPSCVHIPDG